MKRSILVFAVLAATTVGGALAYQAAARQRDYRVQVARGDMALRDDQTFAAIEAYSGAIALRPDSMLAHLRLGETYYRRGDLDEAAREFRRAAALGPGVPRPLEELGDAQYQLQRFPLAVDAYERYLALDDRSARVNYKLALARYREGRLDAALNAIAQVTRLDPRRADAHYLLGMCLREKRRLPEALRAFEQALTIAPDLISAREEIADLYGALGRRQDELVQLQVLAGLDRDHVERQVAVGLAHARAGHGDLAVIMLGNIVERSPGQLLAYGALGRVWLDMVPSRSDALPKALEALAPVASAADASSEMLSLYGQALLQDGNPGMAEPVLQEATTKFPVDPASFLHYANAAERQGHIEAARQALIAYGALVLNDPELVTRATRIATWSLRLAEPKTAVEWFQRAATASPNDARLLASLADAQLRSGDLAAAQRTVARGLEKDPDNAQLIALKARTR